MRQTIQAALGVAVFFVGCVQPPDQAVTPGPSGFGTVDSGGLWVDVGYAAAELTGKACTHELLGDPLKGTVRIDLDSPERVWLVEPSGTRKMILWPSGFRLIAAPVPHVLAPTGASWTDGAPIEFRSVNRQTAIGTSEKPFTVFGWIGGDHCYTSR